jgi:hypothetical protein
MKGVDGGRGERVHGKHVQLPLLSTSCKAGHTRVKLSITTSIWDM